ncbi:MAG: GTP pyrophosphokinase family protein [Aureliella sp.]
MAEQENTVHSDRTGETASEFVDKYKRLEPLYQQYAARLDSLVVDLLKQRGIPVHATEYRSKSIESFKEKIGRPGKRYVNPLVELTDLAGNRVILYYQEDVDKVCDILRAEFAVDEPSSGKTSSQLTPDQFGYNSVHLIVGLGKKRRHLPEWHPFTELLAEIQVRTVLQHAWSAVSHSMQYKRESDIPTALRRRLNRLSGLFELADDEFSAIRIQRQELTKRLSKQLDEDDLSAELNRISISEYLRKDAAPSRIFEAAQGLVGVYGQEDGGELLAAVHEPDHAGDLLAVADLLGLTTIQQLDEILQGAVPHVREFLGELRAAHKTEMFGDVGHWSAVILAAAMHEDIDAFGLGLAAGWDAEFCLRIIKVAESGSFSTEIPPTP